MQKQSGKATVQKEVTFHNNSFRFLYMTVRFWLSETARKHNPKVDLYAEINFLIISFKETHNQLRISRFLFLADHGTLGSLKIDLLPPGPEMLISFFKLLSDRDTLGAVLLTLAALNAERCVGRSHAQCDRLEIFKSSGILVLGIHMVIAGEDRRNIDTLGTRHAVSATRAVYLGALNDI